MDLVYRLYKLCFCFNKQKKKKEQSISFILFNVPFILLDDENKYNNECIICYELFEDLSVVSITTCRHICHKECLARWIQIKKTCPYCIRNYKL